MPDFVSKELRQIEDQIDNAFKSNYLVGLPFAAASWYLLATAEDTMFIPLVKGERASIHEAAIDVDRLLTHILYPLGWLNSSCKAGGKVPSANKEIPYKAALDLLDMAASYKSFVAAFTYATKGLLELSHSENKIITSKNFLTDTRYEAYSRLLKPTEERASFSFDDVFDVIASHVKVSGERFTYSFSPKIAERIKEIVQPVYEEAFILPDNWEFSRYSLKQFFDFATTLATLAVSHWSARYIAGANGCVGLGYCDSIKIFEYSELIARLTRYSSLSEKTVVEIVEDLTYGKRGIKNPDPALQPLIPLTTQKYGLAPWIWMSSAVERNFAVLVNRLPSEKQIYSRLVDEKEARMRQQVIEALGIDNYRYEHGQIPQNDSLPDIDLAIISESEKVALILELKWFIDPADINEIITRTEDLKKGVSQINLIRSTANEGFQPLFDKLAIDTSYRLGFAVVSVNWIGFEDVQDVNVPIINQRHLVSKIKHENLLSPVMEWLNKRAYLPTEGVEYKIVQEEAKLANWTLDWYGIKPLIQDPFLPL